MITYQTHVLNELAAGHDGPAIPRAKLAYFQERFRGRVFDFLISKFTDAEASGLTQAKLGRRINKDPKIVHRWLSAPSNLTLDSLSDLLVGIAAEELELSSSPLLYRPPVNYSHVDDLTDLVQPDGEIASAKNTMFDGQQTAARMASDNVRFEQDRGRKSVL